MKLPDYMIPTYFKVMEAFPLTPSGKVDRKLLPDIEGPHPQLTATFIKPTTGLEKYIAHIWEKALNLEEIGIDDNFFKLGGNSLDMIKIIDELKKSMGKDIPVVKMFEYPTISSFSTWLNGVKIGQTAGKRQEAPMERLNMAKKRKNATITRKKRAKENYQPHLLQKDGTEQINTRN